MNGSRVEYTQRINRTIDYIDRHISDPEAEIDGVLGKTFTVDICVPVVPL